MNSPAAIVEDTLAYSIFPWVAGRDVSTILIDRAEGVHFWDASGKRYFDLSSQYVNVNLGHSHSYVIEALKAQAESLCYVNPTFTTRARGELSRKLSEITPGGFTKSFLTLGGADSVECSIRAAQAFTGRKKIITRLRSFHGGTTTALAASGDPRRYSVEHGPGWIVRVHDPYSYRSPIYRHCSPEQGDLIVADLMEETILHEGADSVAAVLLEGVTGTAGVVCAQGSVYWKRVREICDKYRVLLIADEVMSGWGRTGKWFGFEHGDIIPDIIVTAKGITSGYLPLGAVMFRDEIADFFGDHAFPFGLTYAAHPMACAVASACIDVYRDEELIPKAREHGAFLHKAFTDLAEKHPSIGEVRGLGMHFVLELVRNRKTKEPLSDWNAPLSVEMQAIKKTLLAHGLSTIVRWNLVFFTPPLIATREQLEVCVEKLSIALEAGERTLGA